MSEINLRYPLRAVITWLHQLALKASMYGPASPGAFFSCFLILIFVNLSVRFPDRSENLILDGQAS